MADNKEPVSEAKPLDEQSEAELKRGAKARLKRLSPVAAATVVEETVRSKFVPNTGFIAFLREKAIVGLAVGFVIGTQVQSVVKQFITSFVDPLFKLLLPGDQVLSARTWTLRFQGHTATFGWGALLYTLLDFLFIVFIIYIMMKVLKLDRLDKKD